MTGGVIKKSTKKSIRITDIFEYLDLPAFDNIEIGGTFTGNFETFFHTANGVIANNGRQFVRLPVNEKLSWHYHPKPYGIWPSFEDMIDGKLNRHKFSTSLIFNRLGVWCLSMKKEQLQDVTFVSGLHEMWVHFHQFLLKYRRQLDDDDTGTQYEEHFETWANHLRSFNYDIWFIKRNDIHNLAPLMKAVNNRA